MKPKSIFSNPAVAAKVAEAGKRTLDVSFGGVDLRGTLFYNLDLTYADFRGCDLSRTIFCECLIDEESFDGSAVGTMFVGCEIGDATNSDGVFIGELFDTLDGCVLDYTVFELPQETVGELVGYKVLSKRFVNGEFLMNRDVCIAKLRIPAEAKRLVYRGGKCRASEAYVESIHDLTLDEYHDDYNPVDHAFSAFFSKTRYDVGKTVHADGFDDDNVPCGHGIHFFLTEDEAMYFADEFSD